MKICAIGITGLPDGKHPLRDPRLDKANDLVEASKKTYALVEVGGETDWAEADALAVAPGQLLELILEDLDFIETRLGRQPGEAEKAVLERVKTVLESERPARLANLNAEELALIGAHALRTSRPATVATEEELAQPGALLLRAFLEAGWISFLTVGGKENRAWPLRSGSTAWEAAGGIHTDIQKGFIRAEIIGWNDFIEAGGETQAKRAGKQRLENKTYVMQDCDLVNFRFNK